MTPSNDTETKRIPKLTVEPDMEAGTLVFTFPASGDPEYTVDLSTWPEAMRSRAMYHGAEQKLRDSVANKDIIGPDVRATIVALAESIANGEWSKRGEPGERSETLAVETLIEYFASIGQVVSPDVAKAKIEAVKTAGQMSALKKTVEWVAAESRVRAKRAGGSIDNVLGSLEALATQ